MISEPLTLELGETNEIALALGWTARRLLASVSLELFEPLTLGVEWGRDSDYSARQGGSGENTTTVTVQFSYQF